MVRSGLALFVILWFVIGSVAAYQRGYFDGPGSCATLGNTALTIAAGPLNYVGMNPEVECPSVPQPSE